MYLAVLIFWHRPNYGTKHTFDQFFEMRYCRVLVYCVIPSNLILRLSFFAYLWSNEGYSFHLFRLGFPLFHHYQWPCLGSPYKSMDIQFPGKHILHPSSCISSFCHMDSTDTHLHPDKRSLILPPFLHNRSCIPRNHHIQESMYHRLYHTGKEWANFMPSGFVTHSFLFHVVYTYFIL